jgi:hypothetical protein
MNKKATSGDLLDQMQEQLDEARAVTTTTEAPPPAVQEGAPRVQEGFEGGSNEDLLMPRAKLVQDMSPILKEDGNTLCAGAIINSITSEELPQSFVPIFCFKEWARFNPRNKNDANFNSDFGPGDMIWKTDNPNDPRVDECKFGPNGEPPLGIEFFNFLSLFDGQLMPIVASFSKTSHKTGKRLYTLGMLSGAKMWQRKYKLTSNTAKNDSGEYYILDIALDGKPDEETEAHAASLWQSLGKSRVQVDISGE